MDVDTTPSSSSTSTDLTPFIDENTGIVNAKQRIMGILDNLEEHVEKLRKDAAKLEDEKDEIVANLDTIKIHPIFNELTGLDKDEAMRYLERINDRCHTVEVNVCTQRDSAQEEALHQVNHFIDCLVVMLKADTESARSRCITYMNSCSSSTTGITDKHFESALLGCTVDDQKRVKKRLQGLLRYFDRLGVVSEVQ